jgi:hypothetical protein
MCTWDAISSPWAYCHRDDGRIAVQLDAASASVVLEHMLHHAGRGDTGAYISSTADVHVEDVVGAGTSGWAGTAPAACASYRRSLHEFRTRPTTLL